MMIEKINRQSLVYIYLKLHKIDMSICVFGVIMLLSRARDFLQKIPSTGH